VVLAALVLAAAAAEAIKQQQVLTEQMEQLARLVASVVLVETVVLAAV
jgi:hypothetical protein